MSNILIIEPWWVLQCLKGRFLGDHLHKMNIILCWKQFTLHCLMLIVNIIFVQVQNQWSCKLLLMFLEYFKILRHTVGILNVFHQYINITVIRQTQHQEQSLQARQRENVEIMRQICDLVAPLVLILCTSMRKAKLLG